MIVMCVPVFADEPEGDDITWTQLTETINYYLDEEGNLTIEGSGEIPDYIDWGTGISPFSRSEDIKSVEIRGEITKVGNYCFYQCNNLEALVLPASIKTIGKYAFENCFTLGSVDFPDGLETIDNNAFEDCRSIRQVVLPDSVTTLGQRAFNNCMKMKTLVLSQNLTDISNAFTYCSQIRTVTIPDGVVKMDDAFPGCSDLTTVRIPASVKNMMYCFGECFGLEEVIFEGDLPDIDGAFYACDLTVRYPYGNETWTEEARDSGYGGKVKWEGYCIEHRMAAPEIRKATPEADGCIYQKCSLCGEEEIIAPLLKVSNIKLAGTSYTHTGKAIKPKVTVANAGETLAADNYTVTYSKNTNAGTATVKVMLKGEYYEGSKTLTFRITQAANPLSVKPKTATVKYSKLKKKAQTLAASKVITFSKKASDKKTYTLVSAKKGSKEFTKYFKINKTTGKVTLKKGLKKGTYKVKATVKAAGNANYKASAAKTVTFKIKVK